MMKYLIIAVLLSYSVVLIAGQSYSSSKKSSSSSYSSSSKKAASSGSSDSSKKETAAQTYTISKKEICEGDSCNVNCDGQTDCHYCANEKCCETRKCTECVNTCRTECDGKVECNHNCVNQCSTEHVHECRACANNCQTSDCEDECNKSNCNERQANLDHNITVTITGIKGKEICQGNSCPTRCTGNGDCHYCSQESCCETQTCNSCVNSCRNNCNGPQCNSNCVQNCASDHQQECRQCSNRCTSKQCYQDCSETSNCGTRQRDADSTIIINNKGKSNGKSSGNSKSTSNSNPDVKLITTVDLVNNINNLNRVDIPIDIISDNVNDIKIQTTNSRSGSNSHYSECCQSTCENTVETTAAPIQPSCTNYDCKSYCNSTGRVIPYSVPKYYPVEVEQISYRQHPVPYHVNNYVKIPINVPVYVPHDVVRSVYQNVPYTVQRPCTQTGQCPMIQWYNQRSQGCGSSSCTNYVNTNQGFQGNNNCGSCNGCYGRSDSSQCFKANSCSSSCINYVNSNRGMQGNENCGACFGCSGRSDSSQCFNANSCSSSCQNYVNQFNFQRGCIQSNNGLICK